MDDCYECPVKMDVCMEDDALLELSCYRIYLLFIHTKFTIF